MNNQGGNHRHNTSIASSLSSIDDSTIPYMTTINGFGGRNIGDDKVTGRIGTGNGNGNDTDTAAADVIARDVLQEAINRHSCNLTDKEVSFLEFLATDGSDHHLHLAVNALEDEELFFNETMDEDPDEINHDDDDDDDDDKEEEGTDISLNRRVNMKNGTDENENSIIIGDEDANVNAKDDVNISIDQTVIKDLVAREAVKEKKQKGGMSISSLSPVVKHKSALSNANPIAIAPISIPTHSRPPQSQLSSTTTSPPNSNVEIVGNNKGALVLNDYLHELDTSLELERNKNTDDVDGGPDDIKTKNIDKEPTSSSDTMKTNNTNTTQTLSLWKAHEYGLALNQHASARTLRSSLIRQHSVVSTCGSLNSLSQSYTNQMYNNIDSIYRPPIQPEIFVPTTTTSKISRRDSIGSIQSMQSTQSIPSIHLANPLSPGVEAPSSVGGGGAAPPHVSMSKTESQESLNQGFLQDSFSSIPGLDLATPIVSMSSSFLPSTRSTRYLLPVRRQISTSSRGVFSVKTESSVGSFHSIHLGHPITHQDSTTSLESNNQSSSLHPIQSHGLSSSINNNSGGGRARAISYGSKTTIDGGHDSTSSFPSLHLGNPILNESSTTMTATPTHTASGAASVSSIPSLRLGMPLRRQESTGTTFSNLSIPTLPPIRPHPSEFSHLRQSSDQSIPSLRPGLPLRQESTGSVLSASSYQRYSYTSYNIRQQDHPTSGSSSSIPSIRSAHPIRSISGPGGSGGDYDSSSQLSLCSNQDSIASTLSLRQTFQRRASSGPTGLRASTGSLGGMSGNVATAAAGFSSPLPSMRLSTRGLGMGIGGSMRLNSPIQEESPSSGGTGSTKSFHFQPTTSIPRRSSTGSITSAARVASPPPLETIPSVEAHGSIEVVPSCADLSEIVKQDSQHELQDLQPPTNDDDRNVNGMEAPQPSLDISDISDIASPRVLIRKASSSALNDGYGMEVTAIDDRGSSDALLSYDESSNVVASNDESGYEEKEEEEEEREVVHNNFHHRHHMRDSLMSSFTTKGLRISEVLADFRGSTIVRSLSDDDLLLTSQHRLRDSCNLFDSMISTKADMRQSISRDRSWELEDDDDDQPHGKDAWDVLIDEYAEEYGYGPQQALPFQILGTSVADVSSHPHVLSPPLMDSLFNFLPYSVSEQNFWMKYSLKRDGASLYTLLKMCRPSSHTIIAIETTDGEVFGSFTSSPWRKSKSYFGSGESFLWRMREGRKTDCQSIIDLATMESEIDVFPFTCKNYCIQYCNGHFIGLGADDRTNRMQEEGKEDPSLAGGAFGLAIDDDLLQGTSTYSTTFDNPPLSQSHEDGSPFDIMGLEIWTLSPAISVEHAERLEFQKLFLEENSFRT